MTKEEILIACREGDISTAEAMEKLQELREASRSRTHRNGTGVPRNDGAVPLSEGQAGLWMLHTLSPEMSAYNVPLAFRTHQPLDLAKFRQACELMLLQYPILNTSIYEDDGIGLQRVDPDRPLSFKQVDSRGRSESEILQHVRTLAQEPFDLENGPLFRVHVFDPGSQSIILITVHHIVIDGASAVLLMRALWTAYRQLVEGTEPELKPQRTDYADFVHWEREMLGGERGAELLKYWRQQLDGELPILSLPQDRSRPRVQSFAGATAESVIDGSVAAGIRELAKAHRLNLSVILLGAFKCFLSRYTGLSDIIVGMPTMGRPRRSFEDTVGYFINMVPVRSEIQPEMTFEGLLKSLQWTVVDALDHAEYPFPRLVRDLNIRRDGASTPVFQTTFSYQSFLPASAPETHDAELPEPVRGISQEGESEFGLVVFDEGEQFRLNFIYNPDLFDAATIREMVRHFSLLVSEAVADPKAPLSEMNWLPAEHLQKLVSEWNRTTAELPGPDCIHRAILDMAAAHPERAAIVFGEASVSYAELETRSQAIARYLQAEGIGTDDLVAVASELPADMVVFMLGILRAGGAFLPLDPKNPESRLNYLIADSKPPILLTDATQIEKMRAAAGGTDCRPVAVDVEWPAISALQGDLEDPVQPENLAYVIYTSGSTGDPKAVMIEHRMIHNYIHGVSREAGLAECTSFALLSTLYADLGYTMLWPALSSGGILHILTPSVAANGPAAQAYFAANEIDALKITPSHYASLQDFRSGEFFAPNKVLLFGGEQCSRKLVANLYSANVKCELFNHYGPTETTVGVAAHLIQREDASGERIPIGRPLPNASLYVLDTKKRPVPVGVAGELWIGGAGVARGYLHRPELTAERFVENPFAGGTVMYRTGDRARWKSDGRIEFLGRVDHQVKVRGYRIECGEIEAALLTHPSVRNAAVIAREAAGTTQLIAFCAVGKAADAFTRETARAHAASVLPDYMIPAAFVLQEALPLTPNGKVDRRSLLASEVSLSPAAARVAPKTDTEKQLAAIWESVLETAGIGIRDNFFELGGHSLAAIQIISRIRRELFRDVPLHAFFEAQNIENLAAAMRDLAPVDSGDQITEFVQSSTELTF